MAQNKRTQTMANSSFPYLLTNYPFPPSLNKSYPTNRMGRRFPSQELTKFKNAAKLYAISQDLAALVSDCTRVVKDEDVFIKVDLLFSIPKSAMFTKDQRVKKLDVDNRIKAVFDSISDLIQVDDRHFQVGSAMKCYNESKDDYWVDIKIDYVPIEEHKLAKVSHLKP